MTPRSLPWGNETDDFPDADGDGRQVMTVYDFGPGDEVTMRPSVFARRGANGEMTTVGPQAAEFAGL